MTTRAVTAREPRRSVLIAVIKLERAVVADTAPPLADELGHAIDSERLAWSSTSVRRAQSSPLG